MNNLTVIDQREVLGKDFKIYGNFENPLFLAKDVAEWLEMDISNASRLTNNLDETEYITTRLNMTNAIFLTEDGIYEVLMQSRKPIAKEFKKKVKEILKDIRKHGMYATDELLDNPDLLIQVATKYKEEKSKRIEAEKKIEIDKPKVIFADSVSASHTSILVGELAKILKQSGVDIGANRLFEWLRKEGYLIKRKGTDYNMPTQYSMELGLFEIKETSIAHSDGHISISKTPKITGKGQIYFINKIKNN